MSATVASAHDTLVLLHGSANGSHGWGLVRAALGPQRRVLAPDMLGYGKEPAPSPTWSIEEEVRHLARKIDERGIDAMHLVAHSLGSMFALHLRRELKGRVTRLTLIDPLIVSVLREQDERAALDEMQALDRRFQQLLPDPAAAARHFVDHWNGAGGWDAIGARAHEVIVGLVPRVRLEMNAGWSDRTPLPELAQDPPPTTILVGERTRLAPRATARRLAAALGASVLEVPGAGHMIPLTHPAAVATALEERPSFRRSTT
jgi:pimeloyl-ACP methyl ester carboxylesterase